MADAVEPIPQRPPPEQVLKAQIGQEFNQIKGGGGNVAERIKNKINEIVAKANFAFQDMKRRVKEKWDKGDREVKKDFEGPADNPDKPLHNVVVTHEYTKEALKTYKDNPDLIPVTPGTTGYRVIKKLTEKIDNPEEISDVAAPYIYRVIHRALNESIADPLQILDVEEVRQLKDIGGSAGQKIIDTLTEVAIDIGKSGDEVNAWKQQVEAPPPPPKSPAQSEQQSLLRQDNGEHKSRWLKVPKKYWLPTHEEIMSSYQLRDFVSIATRLRDPRDHLLLGALLAPRNLNLYFEDIVNIKVDEYIRNNPGIQAQRYDELPDPVKDHIAKEISEDFGRDIKLLMGKLFREVDETAPEEFWEEAARAGSPFENTDTQSQAFLKQLTNLRFEDYSNYPVIKSLKFFSRQGFEEDVRVPVRTRYETDKGVKEEGSELRRVVGPFFNHQEISLREYFLTLYNGAKDEVGVRKFLHNATALFYQPTPEKGYYRQLASYAENFLPASAIDILSQLPDSEAFLSASQLEDKLLEADFAKHNWVHKPTLSTLDLETKRTERDDRTIEYLGGIHQGLLEGEDKDPYDSWRIRRALAMGVGDNHSISLKAMEHGARADAPLVVEGGYGVDIASYDKKDHIPFMAFNPFNHYNLRYSMDRTLIGDLVFLPVEGDIRTSIWDQWDHNSVMKQMQRMKNSYVIGRDTDRQTMLIDYTNIGRTGSIYTRTGSIDAHSSWRKIHSYEGYIDGFGDSHNVLHTWKNIENIGVEVLIDYIDRIGNPGYNTDFYEPKGKTARQEVVDHIFRRYFRDPGQDEATVDQADIDKKFKQLEESENIKGAYKEFYYQTMTRAFRQRIPTKFLRYERNREVVGRQRAWEAVRLKTVVHGNPLEDSAYQQAVRDLIACEVYERKEATAQMRGKIESMRNDSGDLTADAPKRLHQFTIDYELTKDKVRRHLEKILIVNRKMSAAERQQRIDNAVEVLDKLYQFTNDPQTETDGTPYLDKFAKKYENNIFPFAMGVEELERSLLAQRASGERTPTRAIADIANIEEKVSNVFADYWLKLKDVASNGKRDFSELVHAIETAKDQLEIDIGPDYAEKFAHHMAAVTISYFKKDTVGRFLLSKLALIGANRKYSIAAEFAGTWRGVWEWNVNDIANFCNVLEARSILPKDPYEAGKPPEYEEKPVQIKLPFTDKVLATLPFKRQVRKHDREWYGGKLRAEFGATNKHIIMEYINKAVPIVAMVALYAWIKDAMDEAAGKEG